VSEKFRGGEEFGAKEKRMRRERRERERRER
jgi:hypothetical protein